MSRDKGMIFLFFFCCVHDSLVFCLFVMISEKRKVFFFVYRHGTRCAGEVGKFDEMIECFEGMNHFMFSCSSK
jgi:hypothetical protein